MGRRNRQPGQHSDTTDWASERTLADAEQEQAPEFAEAAEDRCVCGSTDFLLEAYLHVAKGAVDPTPVEVGRLSCPDCGREFEAVQAEGGRVLRGEFLGYIESEEESD